MKKSLLFGLALLMSATMMAQTANDSIKKESPWKFSGLVGLDASATGLWNWSAGGKNNVSGVVFGKLRLLYDNPSLSWETNLDIQYGMSWIDQKYDKLQKTSDHLKFDSKIGWAFHPKWYLTLNAAFETQMDKGFNYTGDATPNALISNILAPSYTDISVGIDWKPNSIFSLYLSPINGRITTAYLSDKVNDEYSDILGYDVRTALQEKIGTWHFNEFNEKEYCNARAELGLNFKGSVNYEYKGLKIISTLTLFTPYSWDKTKMYTLSVGSDPFVTEAQREQMIKDGTPEDVFSFYGYRDNNRRFGNFDVDWAVAISYQFLKCLNVTLTTDLKYVNGLKIADKDEAGNIISAGEKVQFQGIIGLGIGYSF